MKIKFSLRILKTGFAVIFLWVGQVLSLSQEAYLEPTDISAIDYLNAPHIFAVRSYKFWTQNPEFASLVFDIQWKHASIEDSFHP